MYIYQYKGWPNFIWNKDKLSQLLIEIRHLQGRLLGRMQDLGFSLQTEATLENMTLEILKSNEIEGEFLDADQVRSSIARKMGLEIAGLVESDRNVDGVVEMMMDATQKFREPLTEDRLFGWHSALFPSGRSGMYKIVVGSWRSHSLESPMQVVSGPLGREKVHFQAPDGDIVPAEMNQFLDWFISETSLDPVIKAAIAHLWFVTIHPFDDGNGRITRTITEMQLARADNSSQRFYSMSAQIRIERKSYYDILEQTQKGSLDITDWLEWFLSCLGKALEASNSTLSNVLNKARYWNWLATKSLNERQKLMINKLLDGFDGKLTTTKWAKIAKCSQDTAYRDVIDLMEQGVLVKEPGGSKNTSYLLNNL